MSYGGFRGSVGIGESNITYEPISKHPLTSTFCFQHLL